MFIMVLILLGIFTMIIYASSQNTKDVVFVLDRSGSLDSSNIADAIEFVYNVTEWLSIGQNDIMLSLVSYSSDVREEFPLGMFVNKTELLSAISYLNMTSGGGTYTFDALKFVLTSSFNESVGGRSTAAKAVVVITDGASSNPLETANAASELKVELNADVFSIGVGNEKDQQELNDIASDPDSYFAMSIEDYVYLCNLVPSLVFKLDLTINATLSQGCPVYVPITTTFKPKVLPTTKAQVTDIITTTQLVTEKMPTTFEETTSFQQDTSTLVETNYSQRHSTAGDGTTTNEATRVFPEISALVTTIKTVLTTDSLITSSIHTTTLDVTTEPSTNTLTSTLERATEGNINTEVVAQSITSTQETTSSKLIQSSTINNLSNISSGIMVEKQTETDTGGMNTIVIAVIVALAVIAIISLILFCVRKKIRSGKTKAISTDEFMVRQYTVVSLGPSKPLSYTEATLPLCKAHNGTTRISGRR